MIKTNAMRLLTHAGIPFRAAQYDFDPEDLNGMHAAQAIGMPPEKIFKTLVTRGDKTGPVVFCIPVCGTLDLHKAARASQNKKVTLLHVRELQQVTGYIRGGCSPIGMKKQFPTYIDESAGRFAEIGVSGGARGLQLLLSPDALRQFIDAQFADLTDTRH